VQVHRTQNGTPETIAIRGGFAEVNAKGLTILAEQAGE